VIPYNTPPQEQWVPKEPCRAQKAQALMNEKEATFPILKLRDLMKVSYKKSGIPPIKKLRGKALSRQKVKEPYGPKQNWDAIAQTNPAGGPSAKTQINDYSCQSPTSYYKKHYIIL
jgi:hypothetical protein